MTNPKVRTDSSAICPQPIPIYTDRPEEEVWKYVDKLTSLNYVEELLRYRTDSDYFRCFGQHVEELIRKKLIFLDNEWNIKEQNVIMHNILSDNKDIKNNAREIVILIRQAIELYHASKATSIYARPILLYYSFSKLARVLFLATYRSEEPIGKHGLSLQDNTSVQCQIAGAFARFHDSYSWDPSIYLSRCEFKWEDLIAEPQNTSRYQLILNMRNCNIVYSNEKNKTKYLKHELTREIIFTYAIGMLARYRVEKWSTLIEGKQSGIIWNIQEYLASVQSLFPNLILNQLDGQQYYFYPLEPEFLLNTEVRPVKVPWIL